MPATVARPRVVAALSGGVDSATAAALMVEAGYEVIGMTMRLYDAGGTTAGVGRCCGPRDLEDARQVCDHLGIPFYVVDFSAEFAERVVTDFVDHYLAGETPNPCARCNQHIKFTPLLRRARALGADLLVTGHYARLEPAGDEVALRRGRDPGKDQSYFLFAMPAAALPHVRFPLGGLGKDEVRARAAALGLPNAGKPESQEICFVPDGDYAGFVARHAGAAGHAPQGGEIVDAAGAAVGRHDGIHRFTIGQRRGVGDVREAPERRFVARIEPASRRVVISDRAATQRRELEVGELCWLSPAGATTAGLEVQVRHRGRPIPAAVSVDGAVARVTLAEPVSVAPGQAAVFYAGDRVVGGGWVRAPAP